MNTEKLNHADGSHLPFGHRRKANEMLQLVEQVQLVFQSRRVALSFELDIQPAQAAQVEILLRDEQLIAIQQIDQCLFAYLQKLNRLEREKSVRVNHVHYPLQIDLGQIVNLKILIVDYR